MEMNMKKSTGAAFILFFLSTSLGWAGDAFRLTEAEAKEAALVKPLPQYPEVARQLKITGRVELEISIDETGHVSDVKVSSGNSVLTRPCAKIAAEWKFKPFIREGKPARAVAPLTFEFK
jgi:TonB family protein